MLMFTCMPKLSIIIPTHNRQDMLSEAIESTINQSFTDLEVIVVDDGSTVPSSYDGTDSRLLVYRHDRPKGAPGARNTGLSLAQGVYVAFLDDDDTLYPDYAAKMLDYLETYCDEIDFSWPALEVLDVVTGKSSLAQQYPCLIRRDRIAPEQEYAAAAYTRTTGMMFRTESVRRAGGFDESLAVSEDRELIFRMLSQGYGCGSIGTPLVKFFVHSGPRLSTDENKLNQAQCDALVADRHAEFISRHPKLASRYLNLLARRQKDAGLITDYRSTLLWILRINRWDIRALRRLLFAVLLQRDRQ